MLWRSHVEPVEIHGPIVLGPWSGRSFAGDSWAGISEGVLLGGAGMASFRDREVWRRLLAADFPNLLPTEIVFGSAEGWAEAVPRSRASAFFALSGPAPFPEPPGEGWAMVVRAGVGQRAMIGSPNEEAWDRFKAVLMG